MASRYPQGQHVLSVDAKIVGHGAAGAENFQADNIDVLRLHEVNMPGCPVHLAVYHIKILDNPSRGAVRVAAEEHGSVSGVDNF